MAIQYQIELAASGYEDKHSTQDKHLSIAVRREILKRHRNAWNTLDWIESRANRKVDDYTITSSDAHLSGGMYAIPGNDDRSITFYELPSLVGGIRAREWPRNDVGISFVEFSFDRGLDLLLLIEKLDPNPNGFIPRVHVLSLSDLSAYPAAKRPLLDFPSRLEFDSYPYRTQIEGDIYGVWFESDIIVDPDDEDEDEDFPGMIVLWNYIEGNLLGSLRDTENENITSFIVIDSETVLVTQTSRKVRPKIVSVNIYRVGIVPESFILIASFRLPALTVDVANSRITIVSAIPPPSNIPPSPRLGKNTTPYFPFRIARNNRMIAMRWVIEDPDSNINSKHSDDAELDVFRIFVHLRTFTDRIPSGDVPAILEWNDWGPGNTRILPETLANLEDDDTPSEWQNHGCRFISHAQPIHPRWYAEAIAKVIMVLDFTDHASRFWKCTNDVESADQVSQAQENYYLPTWGKQQDTFSYIVPRNAPTVIDRTVFADQVVSTSLPYCVATRYYDPGDDHQVDSIYCDDEHIVCKLSDDHDGRSQFRILTME